MKLFEAKIKPHTLKHPESQLFKTKKIGTLQSHFSSLKIAIFGRIAPIKKNCTAPKSPTISNRDPVDRVVKEPGSNLEVVGSIPWPQDFLASTSFFKSDHWSLLKKEVVVQLFFGWVSRWVSRWVSGGISVRARPAHTPDIALAGKNPVSCAHRKTS